jgi:uncharacterized protein (TIGR02646 family)
MIQLENLTLSASSQTFLKKKQEKINAKATFSEQVTLAKSSWQSKSRKSKAMVEIIEQLEKMGPGPKRCTYCEDSRADEIEHIEPKNYFPNKTFAWSNYCYACGPCNGPKNDSCAVYQTVDNQKVTHENFPNGQPPVGTSVLINPRSEDPMQFLKLSLVDLVYLPLNPDPTSRSHERAIYTIETLHLNDRDDLIEQRVFYYNALLSMFKDYVANAGNPNMVTERINWRKSIKKCAHRTVWKEMQRQRTTLNPDGTFAYPQLHALFTAAPEALNW